MKSKLSEAADLLERSEHFQERINLETFVTEVISGDINTLGSGCHCIVTAVRAVSIDPIKDLLRMRLALSRGNDVLGLTDYSDTHSKEECVALMRRAAKENI